jgi:hypothetical protein
MRCSHIKERGYCNRGTCYVATFEKELWKECRAAFHRRDNTRIEFIRVPRQWVGYSRLGSIRTKGPEGSDVLLTCIQQEGTR